MLPPELTDEQALNMIANLLGRRPEWDGPADLLEYIATVISSTGRTHPGDSDPETYDGSKPIGDGFTVVCVADLSARHIGLPVTVTETAGSIVTGALETIWHHAPFRSGDPTRSDVQLVTDRGEYKLRSAEPNYLVQVGQIREEVTE